jgi:hypothetical protein
MIAAPPVTTMVADRATARSKILVGVAALVAVWAFSAPVLVLAQATPIDVDQIGPGSTLTVRVAVPLRATAPSGPFYRLGAQTGVIQIGEKVVVEEIQTFPTPLGKQKWLKINRQSAGAGEATSGWAYAGDAGGTSCCFGRR